MNSREQRAQRSFAALMASLSTLSGYLYLSRWWGFGCIAFFALFYVGVELYNAGYRRADKS